MTVILVAMVVVKRNNEIRLHPALHHHLLQYREKSINIRECVVGRRRS
jgi:hypothetical protein